VRFGAVLEVNGGAVWGCFRGQRRCGSGLREEVGCGCHGSWQSRLLPNLREWVKGCYVHEGMCEGEVATMKSEGVNEHVFFVCGG